MVIKSLIKRTLFLFVLSCIFSCNQSESYIFTEQATLRIIERQDHQKCISEGLDYGDWDDFTTELYWRCRYDLIQSRIINHAITPQAIRENAVIEKISNEILKNLTRANFAVIARIDDDIAVSDHNKCYNKFKYKLSGVLPINMDDYYRCRQQLVLNRIPPAPRITHYFDTAVLPEGRAKEYMKLVKNVKSDSNQAVEDATHLMQRYPNCAGLSTKSDDFQKCSAASDESKVCLSNIESMKLKKQLQDKLYCQKQSFIQFPDNYALAKDKSASEIARIKDEEDDTDDNAILKYLEGDLEDKNIGRQLDDSGDKQEESKQKLYSKIELLRLREQFIYQCNQTMDDKLPEFANKVAQDCLHIAKNWDK